jgi:hypothetical protein
MKKIFLIFNSVFLIFNCSAQTTFQKTYGPAALDYLSTVKQTIDGGYLVAGITDATSHPFLIKTNSSGDTVFTKILSEITQYGFVQQMSNGSYLVTGSIVGTASGDYDYYLIRLDGNGNIICSTSFDGNGDERIGSAVLTSDGGAIIAGWRNTTFAGYRDAYLARTDSNCNVLWAKTFGGTGDDEAISINQTSDGDYVFTGITESFGVGSEDIYLVKVDGNGNLLWSKTLGGSGQDYGSYVEQTNDSGFVIIGITNSFGAGNDDAYLIKTDANGDTMWSKTYGGSNLEFGSSVHKTSDGGLIVAGQTLSFGAGNDDAYLIKTDNGGNLLWSKAYGGTDYDQANSVQQTADGGYIVNGHARSFGTGSYDIYLIKTDSLGNSGCYDNNVPTIVTSPPTQVTTPVSVETSISIVLTTAPINIGSGAIVTSPCYIGVNDLTEARNIGAVSPNPFTTQATINFSNEIHNATFSLYNLLGEKIAEIAGINGESFQFNRGNLLSGVYVFEVREKEKSIGRGKAVVY